MSSPREPEPAERPAALVPGPGFAIGSAALLVFAGWLLVDGRTVAPLAAGTALAVFWYVHGFLMSAVEAIVFSSEPAPIRAKDFLGALLSVAALAALIAAAGFALGTFPADAGAQFCAGWTGAVERFGVAGIRWRVAAAAVAFLVAYCGIGSATWPLVRRFYEGDGGYRLRVPGPAVIFPLQLVRGTVATTVLLPWLLLEGRPPGFFALSGALVITSAVVPLLLASSWPARLRWIHGVEISVFSIAQAAWLGALFAAPA